MLTAAWIFGGLLVLFLMFVVIAPSIGRPIELDPTSRRIIGFLVALDAAFMGLFFASQIDATWSQGVPGREFTIKAGGAAACFVVMLWWWERAGGAHAAPRRDNVNLTNNDIRVLLAMEDGENRLPSQFQERADIKFGYQYEHTRPEPRIEDRVNRFVSLGLAEQIGGSEYRITPHGKHILTGIRQNPGSYRGVV